MKAITLNLGCAGPRRAEYVGPAYDWAKAVRDAPIDIVFAQEIPDDTWLTTCAAEFTTFEGAGPKYRARSAVLVRRSLGARGFSIATAGYHGSYVAGARLKGTVLLSVHASPSVVLSRYAEDWKRTGVAAPSAR